MKGLRKTIAKFTVFAIVSLLAFVLIYNTMQDRVNGETNTYSAIFEDTSGLRVGDNIRISGIQVGKVLKIELIERSVDGVQRNMVKVEFTTLQDQPILDNTQLVMRFQNLLGQRYLALQQPEQRGAPIPAGATLDTNQTDPGFDLTGLLNGFRPLFEVLQPEDVNELARTVVKVLQGEGGTVAQLLDQTTQLTNFVADRDDLLNQVLVNLTPVVENLNGQGDALSNTIDELRALMNGLAASRGTIGQSIDQMSQLITTASDFLVDVRAPSVALLRSMRLTTGMFAGNIENVRTAIRGFPKVIGALGRATSYKNAGNVYLCQIRLTVGGIVVNVPNDPNATYSEVCQ